ncbi:MAG TPA: BamA/TamA family outer membrane protein, partial [Acidobacteriota bacterium]
PEAIERELGEVSLGWLGWEEYLDEVTRLIRRHLVEQGFFSPEIHHQVIEGQPRELRLQVETGPRYVLGRLDISGLEPEAAAELRELLDLQRGEWSPALVDLATNPERIGRVIQAWLEEEGYLGATLANIESNLDPQRGDVVARIVIDDARPLPVVKIVFEGPLPLPEPELRESLRLRAGDRYRPELAEQNRGLLGERLRQAGYADAKVGWNAVWTKRGDQVELRYRLEPGAPARVAGIEVIGDPRTGDAIVRQCLKLEVGDPLNPDRLREAEQRLLETGLYRRVSISAVPPDAAERTIRVELIEEAPYHVDYGARYDSDRGPQVDVEWSDRNFFGRAREGLLQALVSDDFRTVRGGIGEDFPFGWRLPTLLSGFWEWRRETQTPAPGAMTTLLEKSFGLSVEQRLAITDRQILLYGYRWKRVRSESTLISPEFGVILVPPVTRFDAALGANYIADNRDNPIRASRGRFLSLSLEWHENVLGASQSYLRGLEQLFAYQRIGAGWIAAGALRFGFSIGLRGDRPLEGFKAGGGTSLRGFERDAIGVEQAGVLTEGDALMLTSLELRSPLWHGIGTVLFYDAGNVFARLRELRPFELRSSAGLGLRYDSALGLLRLDWGFNLDPKGNEPRSTWFFSFGEMF